MLLKALAKRSSGRSLTPAFNPSTPLLTWTRTFLMPYPIPTQCSEDLNISKTHLL